MPAGGFVSSIPAHLLIDADPQMRWVMEEISKSTAANEFACRAAVTHNEHLRKLNGKTFRNEKAHEEVRAELEALKAQAAAVTPLARPFTLLAGMWDFWPLRVIFIIGALFVPAVVYPWYLTHMYESVMSVLKSVGFGP